MRALTTTGVSCPLFPDPQTSGDTLRGSRRIRRHNRRMTAAGLVFASILALGVPAFMAGSASAASRSAAGVQVPHTSKYCQLVKGVQSSESSAFSKLTTPNQLASAMKAAYQNLKSEESKVLSVIPSQLKASYQTIFSAMNTIFNDLAKVGYNFSKLPASIEKSFVAESSSMSAASNKIATYDKQVCHLNLGGGTTTAGSGNTTVGGSNGSVKVGAKLPAGFPKAVPLPPSSRLLDAISYSPKFYELWLAVSGTQASVFGAYKSALGKAGFTITSSGGAPGTMMAIASISSYWGVSASVFAKGVVSGVPKSDLKAGQVLVALIVT